MYKMGFQGGAVVKNLPANTGDAGDVGLIPGSRRSPGEGNGNLLQCSCMKKFHGQRSLAGYHGVADDQEDPQGQPSFVGSVTPQAMGPCCDAQGTHQIVE